MTNVLRSMPRTCLPYMFFILMTSNCWHSFSSGSEMSSNGNSIFALKFSCDLSESREHADDDRAGLARTALYASRNCAPSVVQPGVLSFG